jgi:hypothetical protein
MDKLVDLSRRVPTLLAMTADRLAPPALILVSLGVTSWLVARIVGL